MSYTSPVFSDPKEIYSTLGFMATAMLEGESDWVCATANLSALIYDLLPDLNWAGFYRVKDNQLILGPFQGKPACTRIAKGKGVCGTAWEADCAQVVPDVHEFPGHIACDSASNSEIVIPIHNRTGEFCGLLDIDSPILRRFSDDDLTGLLPVIAQFEKLMAEQQLNSL